MGTQIIRCSEVFKNKVCVSILFDPAANVNGSLESRAAGRQVRSPGCSETASRPRLAAERNPGETVQPKRRVPPGTA